MTGTDSTKVRVPFGSFILTEQATNEFPWATELASRYSARPSEVAGGQNAILTNGETYFPPEAVEDIGVGTLRQMNNKPKEGGHAAIDKILAMTTLQGLKPMNTGGEVMPNYSGGGLTGYENGGSIPSNLSRYVSQMQVMPDMDIRRSEPLSDLDSGLKRLMELQKVLPDVYEQITSPEVAKGTGERVFQRKKAYPDILGTISAMEGDKAAFEYLLNKISSQDPKKQFANRAWSKGPYDERTGYQIMSQGLAPDAFKDEEKYNSVMSAVENIIYDPETGESRKTRSVPIERMISLDPDVVKRIPDLIKEIEEREKSGEGTVSGEFFQQGGLTGYQGGGLAGYENGGGVYGMNRTPEGMMQAVYEMPTDDGNRYYLGEALRPQQSLSMQIAKSRAKEKAMQMPQDSISFDMVQQLLNPEAPEPESKKGLMGLLGFQDGDMIGPPVPPQMMGEQGNRELSDSIDMRQANPQMGGELGAVRQESEAIEAKIKDNIARNARLALEKIKLDNVLKTGDPDSMRTRDLAEYLKMQVMQRGVGPVREGMGDDPWRAIR